MEFEGFQFNPQSFLKVPGLDMKTEVLAVLRRSPEIIVGGNKPFYENLRKIIIKHKKLAKIKISKSQKYQDQEEDIENIQAQEQALIQELHQQQFNQSVWLSQVQTKQWVFLGGDLYVNFASFQDTQNNENYDSYSHWNEWRPSVQCLRLRNHLHLDMQTDNEGPVEFEGVRNALKSLSNTQSFEVAQLLETYAKYLQNEESKIKANLESMSGNELNKLQLLLSNNYEKSLVKAHNIIDKIGDTFPIVYFVRRTSLRTLREQVSAVGLNYQLTQILCENKEKYMYALHRNGIPEVFSHETHLRLLLLNLRGEGGKEISIRTVDDIEVKCQLTLLYFPLGTVQFQGLQFTDTLRVYKFDINQAEMDKLAARRLHRPLQDSFDGFELEYDMHTDPILQQYYQQFHKSKYCSSCKMNGQNAQATETLMNQEQEEHAVKQEIAEEQFNRNKQLSEQSTDKNLLVQNDSFNAKIKQEEEERDNYQCVQQPPPLLSSSAQSLPTFSLDETLALISQNKLFIQDQATKLLAEYNPALSSFSSVQTVPLSYSPLSQLLLPMYQPASNFLINSTNNINSFTNPDSKPQ